MCKTVGEGISNSGYGLVVNLCQRDQKTLKIQINREVGLRWLVFEFNFSGE